jgi:hypothetical protein
MRSTVGEVKSALIKAGVERGVIAPISYLDHADPAADVRDGDSMRS